MKNKIISLILTFSMLFPTFSVVTAFAAESYKDSKTAVIEMSPTGMVRDNMSLRSAIAGVENGTEHVIVEVDGGKYNLSQGLVIDSTILGSKKLTIKAKDGEKPEFTGTIPVDLTKFEAVTDKSILARLTPSAAPYIGQIDLGALGFTKRQLDFFQEHKSCMSAFPYGVFLNDKKEMLARFPNSGYNRFEHIIDGGGEARYGTRPGEGAIWQVMESNVKRWGQAENPYLEGFFGVEFFSEWAKIANIDAEKQILTMDDWTQYGIHGDHKWAITNLVEEIDIPGEWYVDLDTLIMYYYPRYPINVETDVLEISLLKDTMLTLNNVDNVTIDGITFKNSDGDGINVYSCSDIDIKNCEIANLTGRGIHLDKVTKIRISANTIYETQDIGIYLETGGDRMLLIPNECVISNNHIYRTGMGASSNWDGGIRIGANTIGTTINNNLIHGIKNYSIAFGGNDNTIKYNEIWAGNRESADSMPVYNGRHLNEYWTRIEYNYVHDNVNMTANAYGNHGLATGDDMQSGTFVEHNIIKMGKSGGTTWATTMNGRDSSVSWNTLVDATYGFWVRDSGMYIKDIFNAGATYTDTLLGTLYQPWDGLKENFAQTDAWVAKYPQISTMLEDIRKDGPAWRPNNSQMIHNVSVNAPQIIEDEGMRKWIDIRDNYDLNDYSIFVDADNHDYRVTREAMKKYNMDEGVLNEDNFDMDWIGIQRDVFDVETPETEFMKTYPQNGTKNLQREGLELVWERATFADQYEYVVATDPEMKNIFAEGVTINNSIVLENLENDKIYYWDVKAVNISKQIGNEWDSVGDPYVFTTSKFDELDKTILNDTIADAEELIKTIEEGEGIGDFQKGTIEDFEKEIGAAKEAAAITTGTSEQINSAVAKLRDSMNYLEGYKIKGYTGITADENKWSLLYEADDTELKLENGEIGARAARNSLVYSEPIPNNRVLRFKLKSGYGETWYAIGIKQKNSQAMAFSAADTGYCIVVKPDIFELQKYNPKAKTTGILLTYENNGVIPENEWVDIELGAVNVPGGVEVRLVVNDKVIFDYYDKENANYEEGYFTIIPEYTGGVMTYIKPADSIPEDIYNVDEKLFNTYVETVVESKYYTINGEEYSDDGSFTTMVAPGYESETVKASEGGSAKWNIKTGYRYYRLYYWHTPIENGDKNATLIYKTPMGIGGSFLFEKKIDFSTGTPGWREIGTLIASNVDARTGVIDIEIKGSGNGIVPVSAIRRDYTREGEEEFSKIFYKDNKNLIVMEIGNESYFNNIEKFAFDVAPEITKDRTFVPLRSIAEGFGFDVAYDDSEKTITLTKDDTEVIFTIGEEKFIVNGEEKLCDAAPFIKSDRTLLPLRALSEAVGKTVFWESDRKLILIADKLVIDESNKSEHSEELDMLSQWLNR